MDTADTSPIVLNADLEHSGVRLTVLATFFISLFVIFLIFSVIFRSISGSIIAEFYIALSCLVALPLAIGAAGLSEYIAKRKWLSGRSVVIEDDGITAWFGQDDSFHFRWEGYISLLEWYYKLKGYRKGGRERRVPSGWLCVACQLQQDDTKLSVFSYMPEKSAQELLQAGRFQELNPGQYYESSLLKKLLSPPSRPEIPTKVLAGNQGLYWLAERRRWVEGMELDIEDFLQFMQVVHGRVEE